MEQEYTKIGKRIPRVDSLSKVTGEETFTSDLKLPRMLVGKVKRSPLPHALIRHIDTSKAEKLKGVKAVVTGKDTAGLKWGVFRYTQDMELLPRDKVRYFGEEIAGVAAVDEETALEALDLIDVDLEELPAVFDGDEAFRKDPPAILHEDLKNYKIIQSVPPRFDEDRPNVFNYFRIRRNDTKKGFEASDHVFENRFELAPIHHVQMEPHCGVASIDENGGSRSGEPPPNPMACKRILPNQGGFPSLRCG
jgi:CO/xanthine dehydrogenase Mo-binding subunit